MCHQLGKECNEPISTSQSNSRAWNTNECDHLKMLCWWLHLESGVSGNSRSRSFPRMEASDSLSRTLGMDFFIPFPFPNFGNGFFSFPSRSRILGMDFFHSLPVPEIWEWIFYSLPVPEFWEWSFSIPFPFLKFGNGILNSRSRSELQKVIPAHPWQKYTITHIHDHGLELCIDHLRVQAARCARAYFSTVHRSISGVWAFRVRTLRDVQGFPQLAHMH